MPRIKMKRDNVSLTRSGGPLSVFVFHSEKRPVPGAGGGRPRGTQGEGRDEESRKIRMITHTHTNRYVEKAPKASEQPIDTQVM
jgi:hypothetical protein